MRRDIPFLAAPHFTFTSFRTFRLKRLLDVDTVLFYFWSLSSINEAARVEVASLKGGLTSSPCNLFHQFRVFEALLERSQLYVSARVYFCTCE